jgi:hypothetical protein
MWRRPERGAMCEQPSARISFLPSLGRPYLRHACLTVAMTVGAAACSSDQQAGGDSASSSSAPRTDASTVAASSAPSTVAAPPSANPATVPPTEAPTTQASAATTTDTSILTGDTDMRGDRYCEVLLVRPINGVPNAEVYNSYPINACPDEVWKTLDAAALATQNGVPIALLNGPRYWLMNRVEQVNDGPVPDAVDFGGIEMIQRATVDLSVVGVNQGPYTENRVNRRTKFVFTAGSRVYELVAADGSVYVMQSWSQQIDPTLNEEALAGLGERLQMPEGWAFRTRILDEDLVVETIDADAAVLTDELKNTYSEDQ